MHKYNKIREDEFEGRLYSTLFPSLLYDVRLWWRVTLINVGVHLMKIAVEKEV